MLVPNSIIEETVGRYRQHREEREKNLSQLKDKTKLLSVDDPNRVELRLKRLEKNQLAKTMIAESQSRGTETVNVVSSEEFRQIVQEVVLGQNDLMGVSYLEYALNASRSIGRVLIQDSQERLRGYGTGFLVSPRLLLTNNHVLPTAQTAGYSAIEFNYQTGVFGRLLPTYTFRLNPDTFFITNRELDYTLVAVQPNDQLIGLSSFGWNRILETQGKVIIGEYVNIIQHPGGQPKQLALRENRLIDRLENFLHYQTDTAPGSSGSPVFNDQWEVVGLHHSGVPETDENGFILSIDGKQWTRDMAEDRIAWKVNEGVRISKIIEHLKKQSLSPSQSMLRKELLESDPPILAEELQSTSKPDATPGVTMSNPDDLSITWTIPLQVSVSLGQFGRTTSAPTPSAPSISPPSSKALPSADEVDLDQAIAEDAYLQADLELLERTRQREIPYFDERVNRTELEGYYGTLIEDANSPSKKELFKRLSDLLKQTHVNKLAYAPSRQLYAWVDLRSDLKIRSIYSELKFEPEQIIREDFRIDLERSNRARELMQESANNFSILSTELDLLEAQLPYNCEHVVPQSWFNKKEPMRGDLHHLFACESACNSFRGNIPYFDFTGFQEALRNDCGKSERNEFKFEPEKGKGAVARATLYFLLRYPGEINNVNNEYTSERLKTILDWHKDFPLEGEYELHRNRAIFRKQGNRNPLIDFPDWAEKIDFSHGLGIASGR